MCRRVILWSIPRAGSTAFERSIRQLDEILVLHEPHQLAFYYGPERLYQHVHYLEDGTTPRQEPRATFEAARNAIVSAANECSEKGRHQHLFVKDIAYYIDGKYSTYTEQEFKEFKHTFLIRDPVKVAYSWYKAVEDYHWPLDSRELSFETLHTLYETVKSSVDPHCVVIDADDLFCHPKETMELYCRATGLPFNEDMLKWEPKFFPEWGITTNSLSWYEGVVKSSGFIKHHPSKSRSLNDLPQEYQQLVKRNLPFYEKLKSVSSRPTVNAESL